MQKINDLQAQDPEIKIEPATDNSESENSSLEKLQPLNISIKPEPPDLNLFKSGNCESNTEDNKHDINIPPPPDLDLMKPGIIGSTFVEVKHQIALSPLPIGNIKRELEEENDQNLELRQKAAKLTINETCSQALQRVSGKFLLLFLVIIYNGTSVSITANDPITANLIKNSDL